MQRLLKGAALALGLGLASSVWAAPVNINSADAATLAASLSGVGKAKAAAIVAYRKKHGPFKKADDLLLVNGIGPATLKDNRAEIRLKSSK